VTVPVTNGFNIVANPLDLDGTGTNNTVIGVFSNTLPAPSQVYKFVSGGFVSYLWNRGSWSGAGVGTATLKPGEACFLLVPSNTSVTFVGQVLRGSKTNSNIFAGYNLISSIIPLSGGVATSLQYSPQVNDQVYLYGATAGYVSSIFTRGHVWSPSEPALSPGQGMFLLTSGNTWVQNFTVQ